MIGYTYNSEQGRTVTINTVEKAKSVIIATATTRELSREELLEDKDITSVVVHFGINLSGLSIERSVNPNDFVYTYSFK